MSVRSAAGPARVTVQKQYLNHLETGGGLIFIRDPLRAAGNQIVELAMRPAYLRKGIFSLRPLLTNLHSHSLAGYFAMPTPASKSERLFLGGGDVPLAGQDVRVGISGKASDLEGAQWCKKDLGPAVRVLTVRLKPDILHLDLALAPFSTRSGGYRSGRSLRWSTTLPAGLGPYSSRAVRGRSLGRQRSGYRSSDRGCGRDPDQIDAGIGRARDQTTPAAIRCPGYDGGCISLRNTSAASRWLIRFGGGKHCVRPDTSVGPREPIINSIVR